MNRTLVPSFLAVSLLAACTTDPLVDETSDEIGAGARRWPTATVNYYIDLYGHHANPNQPACDKALPQSLPWEDANSNGVADIEEDILAAIARYEAQTPVRFTRLTQAPSSFDSSIGAVMIFTTGDYDTPHGGGTPAGIASDYQGCLYLPDGNLKATTIQHEIGHNLSMMHEQRRSDRNTYVTYDATCILEGKDSAFQIVPTSKNLTPYDLDSIMHYSSDTFCDRERPECVDLTGACKKPPLLRKNCNDYTNPACRIDSHDDFSADDINALYRMYERSIANNEPGDNFGYAMAAGDFDADGYDDLAVGAPGEAPAGDPATGAVLLFKGTEGGLVMWKVLREKDFTSATLAAGDRFGAALAAGDFDSDGDAELMVGAPGYKSGAGAVFRYNGRHAVGDRGLAVGTIYNDQSPSIGGNNFGYAVAIGKVNGSQPALVVGAPSAAKYNRRNGMVFVRPEGGSWSSLSPDSGGPIGYAAGLAFGAAVGIGNLTGATSGGLVVGAPAGLFIGSGRAFVYSGALASIGIATAPTPQANDQFGKAIAVGRFYVSPSTDLVAIGAPGESNGGLVTLSSVTASSVSRLATYTQADAGLLREAGDQFGAALAAGDVSGTGGTKALVIGAPGEDQGKGTILAKLSSGWIVRNESDDGFTRQANDHFGGAIAVGRFADVDDNVATRNDLAADIAVGSWNRAPNGVAGAGSMQLYFGRFSSTPIFAAGFDQERVTRE